MDEALFLLRTDDDDAAEARTAQQQADQDLLEDYLEGVLPGEGAVGLGSVAAGVVRACRCLVPAKGGPLATRACIPTHRRSPKTLVHAPLYKCRRHAGQPGHHVRERDLR